MSAVEGPLAGGAVAPVTTSFKDIFLYVKHKSDYVRKLDKNWKKLDDEAKFLVVKKLDVDKQITSDEITMEMTEVCKSWRQKVDKINKEVEDLKERYQNTHKFLFGMCPFPRLVKLGRDIVRKTDEVVALKNELKPKALMVPKKLEPFDLNPPNAEEIPSISEYVQKLLKYLQDEEVKRIGIWGLLGVGKSTTLKRLRDEAYRTSMFEKIIWVEAQDEDTVRKIQHEIVGSLRLQMRETNSKEEVAATISNALTRVKYLLLLDQVSSVIDLNEVGIRDHERGKVVIASRCKLHCDKMFANEMIHVERLSNDDAMKLFWRIAGDNEDEPRRRETARRILKELGGLPQVIKAVATSLRKKSEPTWNTALRTLQSRNESKLQGLESKLQALDEVSAAFKLLYNELENDCKKCLLYGTLLPRNYEVDGDYLIECWIAERFISDSQQDESTDDVQILKVARDTGHTILEYLTDVCLLEKCSKAKCFTMPAIFWTVALKIPYPLEEECKSLVKAGEGLTQPPDATLWRDAKRVSLMCNKLEFLPERPECYQISTLLLQSNTQLQVIHDSFFHHMQELRVLDLGHTGILSLPSSVFNITSLKALYLNNCQHLVTLPNEIEKLKYLEFLDITGTGMCSLPSQIGKLGRLMCLRLSFTYDNTVGDKKHQQAGMMIPSNVLGGLCQLEELAITVDPGNPSWITIADEVAVEVASLTRLTTLFFYFPNVECLERFVSNSKTWNNMSFRSFKFIVCSDKANNSDGLLSSVAPVERVLTYSTGENINSSAIPEVLKQSDAFELIGHQGVQNLSVLGMDCIETIKVCTLKNCSQMVSIVNGNITTEIALGLLKELHVINLQKLNCIWEGPLGPKSLANLSILILNGCPSLRNVLSRTIIHQLQKLEHLRVENCTAVTDIVEADSQSDEISEVQNQSDPLTRLEVLELVKLPSLVSVCQDDSLNWKSLQKIEVKECKLLKDLSAIFRQFSKARSSKIICTETWWEALDWEDKKIKDDLTCRLDFISEEPPSVYSTPPEESLLHQCPDLSKLACKLKEL